MGRAMPATRAQRLVAEFLGTFGLLIAITGAALLSFNLPGSAWILRILLIGIAAGVGLAGLIYALGDLSGGHFNPAVTMAAWGSGRFPARDVIPYILAQVAGAIVAVATIAGVAYGSSNLWGLARQAALASEGYSGNGSPYTVALASVFLLEVVLTFLFALVILFSTRSDSSAKNLAPLSIGLTLLMIHFVSVPIDGTSVNPARSFAPALLSLFWGSDRWAIQQDWLFWVAPILGGLLAAVADRFLRTRPE
jgi:aquaporin Z